MKSMIKKELQVLIIILPCFFLNIAGYSQNPQGFRNVGTIPRGKAAIYVYRCDKASSFIDFVQINDKNAFELPLLSKRCMVYFAVPGKNKINMMRGRNPEDLLLVVSEGESYYVRSTPKVKGSTMTLVTPEIALKELKKAEFREKPNVYNTNKYKAIALVSTTITEPELPTLPAIDASFLNAKVRKIWDKIIEIEKGEIGFINESVARQLRTCFNTSILWGDTLNKTPGMPELIEKYNYVPIAYTKKRTPYQAIVADSGYFTLYPHMPGEPNQLMDSPLFFLVPLKEIAQKVKSDLIVAVNFFISLNFEYGSSANQFYINASTVFMTPDGKIISREKNSLLVGEAIEGDNERDFLVAVREFPMLFGDTLDKIITNLKKEEGK
jgi:hypothetical protein